MADPDVREWTGKWQPALHEHQASAESCDFEKRGKATPQWSSIAGMTTTTTLILNRYSNLCQTQKQLTDTQTSIRIFFRNLAAFMKCILFLCGIRSW
ncbi:hypothetical protein ElyMa_004364700 [Elysia marginata]|uniref:Uncharacterized protein n=1 Tax=Elysia marginata TaxID=1093978 RepID=A0AAV4H5M6_9GAST|nr:hypothetical protein ElyMa_004364700 [Elysia marginata]